MAGPRRITKWLGLLILSGALLYSAAKWTMVLNCNDGQFLQSAQSKLGEVELEHPEKNQSSGKNRSNFSINVNSSGKGSKMVMDVSRRFAERKAKIEEFCQKYFTPKMEQESLITNDFAYGRLIHCQIPKVGTTFLKYLTYRVFQPPSSEPENYQWPEEKRKSFILVRDPYERLVSGYICKLVLLENWWPWAYTVIVKRLRPNGRFNTFNKRCGHDVTFPEFIKYIIISQKERWTGEHRNSHFIPIHEQCNICESHFDFIGKLETFKDDFDFILKSVNVSVNVTPQNHEEEELRDKVRYVFENIESREKCELLCTSLRKTWWSFQVRGFISKDLEFPLDEKECFTMSPEKFSDIAWSAHKQSGSFDKRRQKRDAIVELYLQVPLEDRLELRKVFQFDFEMFGYDPTPADIFPELAPT